MEDNDKIVTLTEQGDMGLGARELPMKRRESLKTSRNRIANAVLI